MKKALILIAALAISLSSCQQSEGTKAGTLQKVSHKTFPCDYYSVQIAFEGGVMQSTGDNASYSNAQDFQITQTCADTLDKYVGSRVAVTYDDQGFEACGSSKHITSIRVIR